MSPFSHLLHDLRMRHKIRQAELAALMGYEQRFISALEVGVKTPPADFVERLLETLQLSTGEREELAKAVSSSQRKLVIDTDSRKDIYLLLEDDLSAIQKAVTSGDAAASDKAAAAFQTHAQQYLSKHP